MTSPRIAAIKVVKMNVNTKVKTNVRDRGSYRLPLLKEHAALCKAFSSGLNQPLLCRFDFSRGCILLKVLFQCFPCARFVTTISIDKFEVGGRKYSRHLLVLIQVVTYSC